MATKSAAEHFFYKRAGVLCGRVRGAGLLERAAEHDLCSLCEAYTWERAAASIGQPQPEPACSFRKKLAAAVAQLKKPAPAVLFAVTSCPAFVPEHDLTARPPGKSQ